MKRLFPILAAAVICTTVFAQAPDKMSYQAVVRDNSNNLLANTAVGMRLQILQGSIFGAAVYVETQSVTSNANGLVSLEIGGGTVVSGDFSTIDWANGPYYLKTETDPTGGTTYTITGTSQLLSVPYALYAESANSVSNSSNTFSLEFPQGTDGDFIAFDSSYTVPAGKTLYAMGGWGANIKINGIDYFATDHGGVVPENTTIITWSGFVSTGILLDKSTSLEIIMTTGSYTVPLGKKLVLKSVGNIQGGPSYFYRYNGAGLYDNNYTFPSGSVLIPDVSNIGFTGYLMDE